MLYKPVKFYEETVPSSSVNWWRHEIWISKVLFFDFLENEKSFWIEKNMFPSFAKALF